LCLLVEGLFYQADSEARVRVQRENQTQTLLLDFIKYDCTIFPDVSEADLLSGKEVRFYYTVAEWLYNHIITAAIAPIEKHCN